MRENGKAGRLQNKHQLLGRMELFRNSEEKSNVRQTCSGYESVSEEEKGLKKS